VFQSQLPVNRQSANGVALNLTGGFMPVHGLISFAPLAIDGKTLIR